MKKIISNKKFQTAILILASIFLSICFFSSLILVDAGKETITYKIETTNKHNNDSRGSSIVIKNININGSNIPLDKFDTGSSFKYNKKEKIIYSENNEVGSLKFEASKIANVSIELEKSKNGGIVNIYKNNEKEAIDLYDNDKYTFDAHVYECRTLSILKDYVSTQFPMLFLIISVISIPIFFLLIKCSLNLIDKICKNSVKYRDIILCIFSTFIILSVTIYFLLQTLKIYILVPIFILTLLGLFKIKTAIKDNLHNLFIYLSIIFGMCFIFINPPFQVPDETSHFNKAYVDSFGFGDTPVFEKNGEHYFYSPDGIERLWDSYAHSLHDEHFVVSPKSYFINYFDKIDFNLKTNNEKFFDNVYGLSRLTYVPSAMVFGIARIIPISPLFILLISRLLSFTIWTSLGYYSLKIVPKFKKIFFVLLMLPISLQQGCAINQDFLTNSLFIFTLALIIREIYSKTKVENKNIAKIVISSILLGFCKMGYFPVIFTSLLIPKERFKNTKDMWIKKLIIILPILLTFVFMYLNSYSGTVSATKTMTIGYLLSNPLRAIDIYWTTLWTLPHYHFFRGLINGFGWSTKYYYYNQELIMNIIFIILLFIGDNEKEKMSVKERIIYLLCFAMQVGLIVTALAGFTPNTSSMVVGLQPRYFICALFLLWIGVYNNCLNLNVKNKSFVYGILLLIAYMVVFQTIIYGFYV